MTRKRSETTASNERDSGVAPSALYLPNRCFYSIAEERITRSTPLLLFLAVPVHRGIRPSLHPAAVVSEYSLREKPHRLSASRVGIELSRNLEKERGQDFFWNARRLNSSGGRQRWVGRSVARLVAGRLSRIPGTGPRIRGHRACAVIKNIGFSAFFRQHSEAGFRTDSSDIPCDPLCAMGSGHKKCSIRFRSSFGVKSSPFSPAARERDRVEEKLRFRERPSLIDGLPILPGPVLSLTNPRSRLNSGIKRIRGAAYETWLVS